MNKTSVGPVHCANCGALLADRYCLFVTVSHIRRFFYVYSYAYGELISNALYRTYKEDPSYISKIKKFLSAGGTMSPDDIFKSIGIDTRDPKFWEEGIRKIEDDIKSLEKLTK